MPSLSVNDYRVLVDKSDLTARLAALKSDTALRAVEIDATGSRRFRQIVSDAIDLAADRLKRWRDLPDEI